MGGIRRLRGMGGYAPSDERYEIWFPTNGSIEGAPLIVVVHGTSAAGWSYSDNSSIAARLDHPTAHGFVMAVADLDFDPDPNVQSVRGTWGTDESMTGITNLVDWLGATYGVRTDQFGIWGDSSGGATAMGYLWRHPDRVAAVQTHQGAHDIEAIRALGNSLINGLCDTAYHNNWAAAAATHDPAQNIGLLVPYNDRIRIWYTTGDGLIPTQSQIDFADEVGCIRTCMGAGGHGTGDIFSFADSTTWFADRMGL